jgi:acetyl-CoA carboxylase carboxyl transferase subunit beta
MTSNRPVVGVSALVSDGRRVLMVKRGHEPLKGFWSIPGGHVEAGETLADAAAREVLEETGIAVGALCQVDIVEIIGGERHFVLVVFAGKPTGGELAAGDDAAEARWMELHEIDALMVTDDTKKMIARHAKALAHA